MASPGIKLQVDGVIKMNEKRIAARVARSVMAGEYWDYDEVAKALSGIDMKGLGRDVKRRRAGPDEIESIVESLMEIGEGFRDWLDSQ